MVLGGHGDDMVPILSQCTIHGVPASHFIAKDALEAIVKRTRGGGGEIVNLMGTSAYYAPASSAVAMAEAYLLDQTRLLACACFLEGQYGYKDLYMGVPAILGGKGVEKIVELDLTADEKAMLAKSAASVQGIVDVVKKSSLRLGAHTRPEQEGEPPRRRSRQEVVPSHGGLCVLAVYFFSVDDAVRRVPTAARTAWMTGAA